jgi:hypothetical protein
MQSLKSFAREESIQTLGLDPLFEILLSIQGACLDEALSLV